MLSLVFLFLNFSTMAQTKVQNKKLDAMIVEGMKDWQIPGLVTVVVKDGEVVFQKAYGIKDIDKKDPVDENTLFSMASTTKAIIALSLGMLVDQGKLNWDDKVRDHLPYFKLSDPYITEDARVQDLLTHNLGVVNSDLLWLIDSVSTTETLKRFRHAQMSYPLRGGFTYQNIMYAVAGEVIEAASEMSWATFVEENIFKKLEMNRSQARSIGIFKAGNYVTPHNLDSDDKIVKVRHTFSDQIGAAGMLWSCAADMSNYLKFLVNGGVYNGDTLVKPETFKYLFKPHAFVGSGEFYPTQKLTNPNWTTYGLGWFQHDYKGNKLDFHTGSLAGLVAIAGVMHDKKVAVYVFANMDHAELRHAILYKAMDLYAYNDDSRNWHKETFALYSSIKDENKTKIKGREESRLKETMASLPLKNYEGTYSHNMLGIVNVKLEENKLILNFNDYASFIGEHWHFDTFITEKNPRYLSSILFSFNKNQSGKIVELEIFGEKFNKKE
jgi:CubicO group peptidase (beta-lactamase class C family)